MKRLMILSAAALALTACAASETDSAANAAAEAAAVVKQDTSAVETPTLDTIDFSGDDVVTAESGLKYKVIQAGLENGATAVPGQAIAAHYHGFFQNGEVFDSSYKRGAPLTGPSNGFIKGWNEALGEMKVCEARTLYIKSDLAYGPQDRGSIPGGSTLMFHMQLLAVNGSGEEIYECPKEKVLAGPESY